MQEQCGIYKCINKHVFTFFTALYNHKSDLYCCPECKSEIFEQVMEKKRKKYHSGARRESYLRNKENAKQYYLDNKERIKEYKKKNKDKINKDQKERYRKLKETPELLEKKRAYAREYYHRVIKYKNQQEKYVY